MDAEFENKLRNILRDAGKIEAVKLYRDEMGVELKEAKEAVEALERGEELPQREKRRSPSFEEEIISLLEQGRKIEAIKVYREQTGTGLKESKQAVEALAAERGIATRSGCFGVILVVFFILAGFLFQFLA